MIDDERMHKYRYDRFPTFLNYYFFYTLRPKKGNFVRSYKVVKFKFLTKDDTEIVGKWVYIFPREPKLNQKK